MPSTRHRRRPSVVALIAIFLLTFIPTLPVAADDTAQTPPFTQNWSTTNLITANDNWSGVPGMVGYLGQDITTSGDGADPQTLLRDSTLANDVDVIANLPATNISNGGVGEFEIANPVVGLQGSGTADAPYLLINIQTTGLANVAVGYVLRDIDNTTDNAVQQVALHYRVGATGLWTNIPSGYVADATTGPSLATQVTPVSVVLPDATDDQTLVQVRIMTSNASGFDEWVGIDDISVGPDQPPAVESTTPDDGDEDVALDANLSVTFNEAVDVSGGWFDITCTTSSNHTATATGGTTTFSINPDIDFVNDETCTFTVYSQNVKDLDTTDPPDFMVADHVVTFSTPSAVPPPDLVINEIDYDQPSTDTAEFLEIKNVGANAATLNGVSVAFINGSGGGAASYRTTPLPDASLAAGDYFVVCANAVNTAGCDLDITPETDLIQNGAPDALALVMGSTVLDTVSYEGNTGAPYTEGAGAVADTGAAAPAGPESINRCPDGTDTDQNNLDFLLRPSTPGSSNACPGTDLAPTVTNSTPANGAAGVPLASDITLTFSEPVNVAGTWYAIDCTTTLGHSATVTGDGTTFTLDPIADFAEGESCTVTVTATNVTDQDGNDPPDTMASNHTFTFTVVNIEDCSDPSTPIHAIQGPGPSSPLLGQSHSIDGIVVGDYQVTPDEFGGFYLQESAVDADADTLTSEGIFVFDNNLGVAVSPGDRVRVHGSVAEFNGLTELASVGFVAVCSTGNPLPPATSVSLPVQKVTDLEAYEGMLVSFDQTLTATEVFNLGRFGEVSLSGAGRLYTGTAVADPGPAALAVIDQNNRSRIILDDGNNQQNIDPTRYPQGGLSAGNTLRVGDTLPGLTGVMDFRFSNYRIQPVGPITWTHTNARTAAPDPVGGNLKVASFNVLNFFNGDGLGGGFPTARGANTQFELDRQKAKEISALKAINADIVGLMEIENDAPPNSAIEELVAGLNAEMGAGTYAFIDTGKIGTDEIKVALIYKPAAVSPVGAYQIITSGTDPRFVDTLNRPSLAQTFERASGARLTVVVNHLKSKGSACAGDPDTGDGSGNCNVTRTNAAKALVDWLATDPTGSGDPDFLFIGDFNSYTFEDPIDWITTHGYTNLVREDGGLTPYSYVFNGESGYLDHALATGSLSSQVTGVADWHINPDEPTVLDYNVEFKTPNQVNTFYDPGPYRSSDHDPVIIGLSLADPSAPAVQSTTPAADAVDVAPDANLSVTFTEPVDVTGGWFDVTCGASSTHTATVSGGPLTFTLDPATNFANGESCTWTIYRQNVTDRDTDDPPDMMAADHVVTFSTVFAPPTVDAQGPYDVVEGGSVILSATGTEAGGGALTYAWDLDDNGSFETPGQSVTFSALELQAPQSLTIAVQATGPTGLTATDEATVNVLWHFEWLPPILDLPAVNSGGPGKLTLSFSLGGDQGLAIFRAGYPASAPYTCGEPPPADANEPAAVVGAKGFRYDAKTGLYVFDWKASSSWKGSCRVFVLGLADGSTRNLAFTFR